MDDQWILSWLFFHPTRITWSDLKYYPFVGFQSSLDAYIANSFSNTQSILIVIAFHNNQLSIVTSFFNNDLRHLVKPKSIKWFF
jgi:hypothetical protein